MAVVLLTAISPIAHSQTAGPNVSLVSGTTLPNGDPNLQAQNEGSGTVSSRNALHLAAGGNDYRFVDIEGLSDIAENGDVWLAFYTSTDGGLSWRSRPLPGCPYNFPECNTNPPSPLKGRQGSADPTVRGGHNGLVYYSGISFDRGANAPGNVFVARFIDLNNKENGDPFAYLSTSIIDTGNSGSFLDKSWIATDIPRPGAGTCTIGGSNGVPLQSFPAGRAYMVYSKFTGSGNNANAQILMSMTANCGSSWSAPVKLSESNQHNQGAIAVVNPVNGDLFVGWRRSDTSSNPDGFMMAKCTNGGLNCSKAIEVATFGAGVLYDQARTAGTFRLKAFPALAIDGSGGVYMAWSQRGLGPGNDSRIVVATSADGVNWPSSQRVLVDPTSQRGNQFMPTMAFATGILMVGWYDQRLDHTIKRYTPLGGGQYSVTQTPVGNLPGQPGVVFTSNVDDNTPGLTRRHTTDLRVAQASPAAMPVFAPSVEVSQYKFGSRPGSNVIEQLQVNPPNLPLFVKGQYPFISDYIDFAVQSIIPGPGTTWVHNTAASPKANFHLIWTDNRDVRPPPPGVSWAQFTPVASTGGASLFDPLQARPVCTPGRTGMRNQNLYTSRITQGLVVGSLGNAKPLGALKRAFVVLVTNETKTTKHYRLTIANQPPPQAPLPPPLGTASFTQFSLVTTLDVSLAARSSAARAVFVTSNDPDAKVTVNVAEIAAPSGGVIPGGLTGAVTFNPDIANPDIVNPDIVNPDIVNPDIATSEVYNPDIANPDIANPDIANPDIVNPDIANPDIANPDIVNPDIANPDIANPDIVNPDIANPDIANPDIANPDIASAPTDATWAFSNSGNTAAAFSTKLFKKGSIQACTPGCSFTNTCTPGCLKFQLVLHKQHKIPVAGVGANACTLQTVSTTQVIANITEPQFTTAGNLTNPDIVNPDIANATLALPPGGTANLTLRSFAPGGGSSGMAASRGVVLSFDPATSVTSAAPVPEPTSSVAYRTAPTDPTSAVTSVIGALSANTGQTTIPVTLTVTTTALPDGITGSPYAAMVEFVGGVGAVTWTPASLGNGLSLSPAGAIGGTPLAASPGLPFLVQAQDSPPLSNPQHTATQSLSIRVGDPLVITTNSLTPAIPGTAYSTTLGATGGLGAQAWTLFSGSLPAGLVLSSAGVISGTTSATGSFPITVRVTDSSCLVSVTACLTQSATKVLSFVVDNTPPEIVATITGTAGSNGWYRSDVGISWSVTDPESGIASSTGCGAATLTAETAGTAVTCTATNGAGLSSSISLTIKIDKTAPALSGSRTPAANGAGWNNTDVSASFACTDALSGVATPPLSPQVVATEGAGQARSANCTDAAGNSSSATVTGINIDKTAPTLSITRPANGGTYTLNATVTALYSCADALSGIATCIGTVASGANLSTNTPGSNNFTVTALDQAGNSLAVTNTYKVVYAFTGFLSPLSAAGTPSGSANLGQAIAIKWVLKDANGVVIGNLSSLTLMRTLFNASGGGGACPIAATGTEFVLVSPVTGTPGGSTYTFGSNQFHLNWDTSTGAPTGAGCYTIIGRWADGVDRATSIRLR